MSLVRYLWLLLCYAQYARTSLAGDYGGAIFISSRRDMDLPIELGTDETSGCICRASGDQRHIVCFGSYDCKRFPKIKQQSEALRVRTTVISGINKGEIDSLYYLKVLEIEANHQLIFLKPGIFRNLTNLEQLSISYNTQLKRLEESLFLGLKRLRNLTMVNNGFTNLPDVTSALQPNYLPSLRRLDLSENIFGFISKDAFAVMRGTKLNSLKIALCQIDFIHPQSFLPLPYLKELYIHENDLDSSIIQKLLEKMIENNINIYLLDISSMGFKKSPPKMLLNTIARSTIRKLILSQNKFETISDTSFPKMNNLELLDLRRVFAVSVGLNAFDPQKFPNLRALLLSGNNLPGIHSKHLSMQLKFLDMSYNSGNPSSPVYFEIGRDTFVESRNLQVLNLSYNRIKSIFNYTFRGLSKLKMLSMENGTIFYIGPGTFLPMTRLELLNLANNPLNLNENLTRAQFEGLTTLRVLIFSNCGIRIINEDDNMFQEMPNITHLILNNNLLMYTTYKMLRPLKSLRVLDLSGNLLIGWWEPLFLHSGIKPQQLLVGNNKITHFSLGMLIDIDYLLTNRTNKFEIDLMDNVFICDCNSMYTAYMWLETNGSAILKEYFVNSNFQCSTPDSWENRRVAEYVFSIKSLQCVVYDKISNAVLLMWTLPSLLITIFILVVMMIMYKYRFYLRYWVFLAKLALGRRLRSCNAEKTKCIPKEHKYDAFISYCNDDRDFVIRMVHELETKPPYFKLCIYERDFQIGSFITESIMSSINDSRFIILIISNSFAKSHWCRWETQLAEYQRIFFQDGWCCDPLVMVRVGEVDTKYLTPTLKYLLKTKIYLSWNGQINNEFWTKLRKVIAKDGSDV